MQHMPLLRARARHRRGFALALAVILLPLTGGAAASAAVPTALIFSSYPASLTGPVLSPQPSVSVVDAAGMVVTTDTRTITLVSSPHGAFSCTGGTSKAAVNGVATFAGCVQSTPGAGYRLTAKDGHGGLPDVKGPPFNVASGTAARLQLCWGTAAACNTTPPTDLAAGTMFSLQPSVRVTDAAGITITTDSSTNVGLAILPGTPTSGGPGALACAGGLVKTVVQGVAAFTGCTISAAGIGYRLNATSAPVLTPAASNPFNVAVAGNPTKLAFLVEPPLSVVAGAPFGSNVQVAIENAGSLVISAGILAGITLSIDKGPAGAILMCTGGLTVNTLNGVASFTGCSVNKEGIGYALKATAVSTTPVTTLAAATSRAFNAVVSVAVVTLSSAPVSGVITWGAAVILNVHIGPNGAAKSVALQVSRDKTVWSTIAALVTNANGDASFAYRPSDNRYYRASFAGTPDLGAANSAIVRVVVRQLNVLRPTNLGGTRTIATGSGVTFNSTVRPARPELPQAHVEFVLYRLVGSHWTLVLSQTVAVDLFGRASLHVSFPTTGMYYVRSQAVPTTRNANSGWSALERYAVV